MRLASGIFLALFVLGCGSSSAEVRTGLDCKRANTPVLRMVCGSKELLALNTELEKVYQAALDNTIPAPDNEYLRIRQQEWTEQRDLCKDQDCLLRLYQQRLSDLHAAAPAAAPVVPAGLTYCGTDGNLDHQIRFTVVAQPDQEWDATVTLDGKTIRAITSYSFFGHERPPEGFIVALLGEDDSEFLVFHQGDMDWVEFKGYTYKKCSK